ncbi:MAG: hypothetical protein AVDCRST_MAG04-384 [uncultured Acetobacteraceae bacterium]|uniref:Uncharacterized protein n=1 Tax=uncultured Acetobacteraceae bacterium TaxID=169975 RepID=A0A6J4H6E7_9PROT|nr:MAG: hypothetical protein AVDCRST_MAG04-384 [uncultured Acetobacteraceae bacterium]
MALQAARPAPHPARTARRGRGGDIPTPPALSGRKALPGGAFIAGADGAYLPPTQGPAPRTVAEFA